MVAKTNEVTLRDNPDQEEETPAMAVEVPTWDAEVEATWLAAEQGCAMTDAEKGAFLLPGNPRTLYLSKAELRDRLTRRNSTC